MQGQLCILLHAIEIATKYISSKVRAAGLFRLYGAEGSVNVQGEVVKKLDVVSNEAFISALKRSNTVRVMVSEENPDPIFVHDSVGHYVAVFDPLDGSSNIDANVSIGTIFGIYRIPDGATPSVDHTLQAGKHLVAAGYCMYGSATVMGNAKHLSLCFQLHSFSHQKKISLFYWRRRQWVHFGSEFRRVCFDSSRNSHP